MNPCNLHESTYNYSFGNLPHLMPSAHSCCKNNKKFPSNYSEGECAYILFAYNKYISNDFELLYVFLYEITNRFFHRNADLCFVLFLVSDDVSVEVVVCFRNFLNNTCQVRIIKRIAAHADNTTLNGNCPAKNCV